MLLPFSAGWKNKSSLKIVLRGAFENIERVREQKFLVHHEFLHNNTAIIIDWKLKEFAGIRCTKLNQLQIQIIFPFPVKRLYFQLIAAGNLGHKI